MTFNLDGFFLLKMNRNGSVVEQNIGLLRTCRLDLPKYKTRFSLWTSRIGCNRGLCYRLQQHENEDYYAMLRLQQHENNETMLHWPITGNGTPKQEKYTASSIWKRRMWKQQYLLSQQFGCQVAESGRSSPTLDQSPTRGDGYGRVADLTPLYAWWCLRASQQGARKSHDRSRGHRLYPRYHVEYAQGSAPSDW